MKQQTKARTRRYLDDKVFHSPKCRDALVELRTPAMDYSKVGKLTGKCKRQSGVLMMEVEVLNRKVWAVQDWVTLV